VSFVAGPFEQDHALVETPDNSGSLFQQKSSNQMDLNQTRTHCKSMFQQGGRGERSVDWTSRRTKTLPDSDALSKSDAMSPTLAAHPLLATSYSQPATAAPPPPMSRIHAFSEKSVSIGKVPFCLFTVIYKTCIFPALDNFF